MKVGFVGGIHGSGKSSLCSRIAAKLGLRHESASALISRARGISFPRDKRVGSVPENQAALLYSLEQLASECGRLVLDGHFCLLDKSGQPTPIPRDIFIAIAPRAVVVVQDDPNRIVERLEERDGQRFELSVIERFQEMERDYASDIARSLEVPHVLVHGEAEFAEAIRLLSVTLA